MDLRTLKRIKIGYQLFAQVKASHATLCLIGANAQMDTTIFVLLAFILNQQTLQAQIAA
jgi:hypothetical protein